jgi:hypothetical protein
MATPSVSQQTDVLNSIFFGLKSKLPETRLQSALDLRRYVWLYPQTFRSCAVLNRLLLGHH